MRGVGILLLVVLLCSVSVLAQAQPTQQFSKILISPLYRESMASATNYSYNVTVVPPDRISSVVSAVVSFNAQINGQTQNFTLWVNNQSCMNPSYVVATAFSATGNIQFYFDCSNVITVAGNYTLKLKSAVNTGVVSGWIDLTYMNNPRGSVAVSGTEYVSGDPATIFVQLLDNNANPVENGNCYVDIYYPLSNGTHPYSVSDAPMVHAANGDDGLYYYDLIAPSQLGVYMVSAKCAYNYNWQWIFPTNELAFWPVRQAQTGTWGGAEQSLNNPEDATYDSCQSSTSCIANYTFNVSKYGNLTNVTNINLYYLGEATKATTMTFYYYNGSSMVALSNTLALVATGSTTAPSGIDQLQSNSIPVTAILNGTVKVQVNENQGTTHALYNNWLALAVLSSYGTVAQNVKGNSEMHISGSSDTSDTRFYTVTSCDGFVDGRCGTFTNDAEFNLVEGEIEDFLNVTAKTTQANVQVHYETTFSEDCVSLYWVKKWNGTAWVLFTNYSTSSEPQNENCVLTFNQDMVGGQDYRYWVKMDNFMRWEVDWSKQYSDTVNRTIADVCDPLNFTYVNPIINTTVLSNDTTIGFCQQAKDDQYWIGTYWTQSNSVTTAGSFITFVQEMRFYRTTLRARYEWLEQQGKVLPSLSGINATVNRTEALAVQINTTTTQTLSLVQQMWTWVQSIFGWTQTSPAAQDRSAAFLAAQYYADQQNAVVVQLLLNGTGVSTGACSINIYLPNMTKIINNVTMTYTGDDGLYSYLWLPPTYGSYPARVNCSGASLIGQVSAAASLGVSAPQNGVVMSVIS
jgi:hypothetical protein